MVEQQRKRVEDQMTKMVEELDRVYLRKLQVQIREMEQPQGDMHKCSAGCCDNENYSMHKVNRCIEDCGTPLQKAQQYVQGELERVQNRLQRCVMECNDKIKDKMGPSPTQSQVAKYGEEFENCATKCVDSYCDLLPAMEKTMKKVLSSRKFD